MSFIFISTFSMHDRYITIHALASRPLCNGQNKSKDPKLPWKKDVDFNGRWMMVGVETLLTTLTRGTLGHVSQDKQ